MKKRSELEIWVKELAALTKADDVQFCTGSQEELVELRRLSVESGTLQQLNPQLRPNSFLACSDPADVARVEGRTFICSKTEAEAGPTNNWADPLEMRGTLCDGVVQGSYARKYLNCKKCAFYNLVVEEQYRSGCLVFLPQILVDKSRPQLVAQP